MIVIGWIVAIWLLLLAFLFAFVAGLCLNDHSPRRTIAYSSASLINLLLGILVIVYICFG